MQYSYQQLLQQQIQQQHHYQQQQQYQQARHYATYQQERYKHQQEQQYSEHPEGEHQYSKHSGTQEDGAYFNSAFHQHPTDGAARNRQSLLGVATAELSSIDHDPYTRSEHTASAAAASANGSVTGSVGSLSGRPARQLSMNLKDLLAEM